MSIARRINRVLERVTGFRITRVSGAYPLDFSEDVIRIWETVEPFTMVSRERIESVCRAIDYIVDAAVPGDFVECGVWRGGATMAAAMRLLDRGDVRPLWLYDTFEGMPAPEGEEVDVSGVSGKETHRRHAEAGEAWFKADLADVCKNVASTGYPESAVNYVKGMVEETIPGSVPEQIAVLRLDTDFFESTRHELEHLVPRIAPNGVLIIDDYGHWSGSKRAVDEYFEFAPVLLTRIDYSARMAIIPMGWPGRH